MRRIFQIYMVMAMVMLSGGLCYADNLIGDVTWGGQTFRQGYSADGKTFMRMCTATYDNATMSNVDNVTLYGCKMPAKAVIKKAVVNVLTKFSSKSASTATYDNSTAVILYVDGNRLTYTGGDNISIGWTAGLHDGYPTDNASTWIKTTNEAYPILNIGYQAKPLTYGKFQLWIEYLLSR